MQILFAIWHKTVAATTLSRPSEEIAQKYGLSFFLLTNLLKTTEWLFEYLVFYRNTLVSSQSFPLPTITNYLSLMTSNSLWLSSYVSLKIHRTENPGTIHNTSYHDKENVQYCTDWLVLLCEVNEILAFQN